MESGERKIDFSKLYWSGEVKLTDGPLIDWTEDRLMMYNRLPHHLAELNMTHGIVRTSAFAVLFPRQNYARS